MNTLGAMEYNVEEAQQVPSLGRSRQGDICYWTDERQRTRGVTLAFSERTGGASKLPYASLNLAAHVGDDPASVDENRRRFLEALGLGHLAQRLVTAEQVHGEQVRLIRPADAGSGARAASGAEPVAATDALITDEHDIPLMLLFADCVPVILVAPGPVVAVVHAGWRGALAGLPGIAVSRLAAQAGCDPARISAYVGAHIGACHYEVGYEILSQFVNRFGTVARAESGGLDLGAVVTRNLTDAGVPSCSIALLGMCTADQTDRFFSYRAEGGLTGRHAALVCIGRSSR